jgi:hypothetical protein
MRSILIALLLAVNCFSQTVTPTKVNVTSGYTNPKVVGPYVLHGDFSAPVTKQGVLLTIETSTASQKLFELFAVQAGTDTPVELQSLADGSYLLVGEGRYSLTATFENPVVNKRFSVELGPPKPPPEPPKPDVVVPPDSFNNIGQRVAGWAKGLPKTLEVAKLYNTLSIDLKENEKLTINQAIDKMVAARKQLLKPEELAAYQPLIDKLNEDLKSRWPLMALVASDYFAAIATGLAGAK